MSTATVTPIRIIVGTYPCGATPPTRLVGGSAGEQCLKDKAKVETNQAISWLEVTTLAQLERNLMSKKTRLRFD